jgi:hypothetical protein
VPVRQDGRIIGILERNDSKARGHVGEHYRPLDDAILISAEEPLTRFIELMEVRPYYRLVVTGTSIGGIATRSDLVKLPVRLLAFTLVTHIEMTMARAINAVCESDEQWLSLLSDERRKKVLVEQEQFRRARSEPPLVELTEFADKRDIVRELFNLSTKFKDELKSVENLRDQVAHAASYSGADDLGKFLERMRKAQTWATELPARLEAP